MKFYTTLAIIREHEPCTEGWKKLLKTLGPKFDENEHISFETILDSNGLDRKSTRLNSSHIQKSRMPSSA